MLDRIKTWIWGRTWLEKLERLFFLVLLVAFGGYRLLKWLKRWER